MACGDGAATNKWSLNPGGWKYPLRYQTTVASASCSAGGNFTTRVENYRKILWQAAGNEFLVTDPDGTRYRYQPAGTLAGDTSAWPSDQNKMGQHMRWLLTEISDSQKDGSGNYTNKVTISYVVNSAAGFSAVPTQIAYGGYRVELGYTAPGVAVSRFGTGTVTLGTNWAFLSSVAVYDGTTPIRAYNLVMTSSALTGTLLLQRVESYGADFTLANGVITAGTKLPDVSYEYSADSYALAGQIYSGTEFHSNNTIADPLSSGREQLTCPPETDDYQQIRLSL